jgi:hypothetical protein
MGADNELTYCKKNGVTIILPVL